MQCRVCGSSELEMVIDLGMHPWANNFLTKEQLGKEEQYPLHLLFCKKCTTPQLDYTVKKEVMFSDHTYLSGITKSLSNHFESVANFVDNTFFKTSNTKSVLDIGSNDGTQLKHFKKLGYDVLGVESSKRTAEIANANGINTHRAFFNEETATELGRKFDVINASGVFFHLEELHSVTEGIQKSLADNGVFVIQFLYMKCIMDNMAFDQIYHEHLLYYNLKNLEILLSLHGLELFDAYLAPIHGGEVIAFASHKGKRSATTRLKELRAAEEEAAVNELSTYLKFSDTIKLEKKRNLAFLNKAKADGKTVYAMGAPVKGNTLLNYYGVTSDLIPFLVEKNELRDGLYSPGSHIPIILEKNVSPPPNIYYVLAWNFKKEILANNQDLIEQGIEFYFPVNPPTTL